MSMDGVSALLRTLGFMLLFQAAGAVLFVALAGKLLDRSKPAIQRVQLWSAVAAVAVLVLHLALEAARLAGDYAGIVDPTLQAMVLSTGNALAHAVQVIGLAAIALGALRRGAGQSPLALAGAVATVSAFLLTGHTSVHAWRPALGALLLIHLLFVAYWSGSLLPLYAALRLESGAVAVAVVKRFSSVAIWLVPAIAVAGVLLLLAIANGLPDFRKPYGALILAKCLGFSLLIALAALNRNRLTPSLEAGRVAARRHLQRTILAETMVMASVLAVTAVMTGFYSP